MPIARDQHDIAIDNDHYDEVRDVTPSLLSSFWTVRQGRRRRRLKNSVSRTLFGDICDTTYSKAIKDEKNIKQFIQ